ncbi:MAG: hypothetical protein GXP42_11800 [Chloroflexi bacterium]|nr:hypothetical protein [Chloroflexota bacterium]
MRIAARNATFVQLANYFLAPGEARADMSIEQTKRYDAYLSHEDRARYAQYRERLESLFAQAATLELQQYRAGREALVRAENAEAGQRFDDAGAFYRQAYEQGTEQIRLEALLGLARVQYAMGDRVLAEQALTEADAMTPPGALVQDEICPGWRLNGVYVDNQDIQFDAPVNIILVWERIEPDNALQMKTPLTINQRTIAWKSRLYQIERVQNLLRDGGFNQVVSLGPGLPPGFKALFRNQTLADIEFVSDPALPERGVFLHLQSQGGHSVGIGSESFTIPTPVDQQAYLVGVTYRSAQDARPRIGLYWQFPNATKVEENETDYPVRYPAEQWRRVTYLTIPPPGSERVTYWAMETNHQAFLDIDDLFLFPISLGCRENLES